MKQSDDIVEVVERGNIPAGSRVTRLKRVGRWSLIRVEATGKEVWVQTKYLSFQRPGKS